jgi:hypothetical protein
MIKQLIKTGLCTAVFLLGSADLHAQYLMTTVNSHVEDIDGADLTLPNEAGSDLSSTFETSANFTQLDIRNMAAQKGWKVTIKKQDINWPGTLLMYVRRNSNGMACMTCTGVNTGLSSTNYVLLSNLETDYIFGTGEVIGIDLQFRVAGISLTLPAQSYSLEIVYTLYGD